MVETEGCGVLTEFPQNTKPDRENFPQRNRIVAGMTDATIVVESGERGGSLITALLANDYNRDVYAFPGNVERPFSMGCNHLIASDKAHLITSGKDLVRLMEWEKESNEKSVDRKSTRLNSSHVRISYAVFCLKKKKKITATTRCTKRTRCTHESCITDTNPTHSHSSTV